MVSENNLERSGDASDQKGGIIKANQRDLKGMIRGPKVELDSLLSDPSIRDSLRSDGYYKRHQQKPNRTEIVKEQNSKSTLYKNIPLGFVKNISHPINQAA